MHDAAGKNHSDCTSPWSVSIYFHKAVVPPSAVCEAGGHQKGKKQRWPVSHSLPVRVRRQVFWPQGHPPLPATATDSTTPLVLSARALPFMRPTCSKGAAMLLGSCKNSVFCKDSVLESRKLVTQTHSNAQVSAQESQGGPLSLQHILTFFTVDLFCPLPPVWAAEGQAASPGPGPEQGRGLMAINSIAVV